MTVHLAAALLACFLILAQGVSAYAISYTSLDADCNISLEARGDRLYVQAPAYADYSYMRIGLLSASSGELHRDRVRRVSGTSKGTGTVSMDISNLVDGTYYLQLWKSTDGRALTKVMTDKTGFVVKIRKGRASVEKSAVYDVYRTYFGRKDSSVDALYYYLKGRMPAQAVDPRIKTKADEITAGVSGAYARTRAIHDWVSDNVYYDADAASSDNVSVGGDSMGNAVKTLESRRAVCLGYADLTSALLRAEGIPAHTVIGYALTGDNEAWTPATAAGRNQNHAWVEAFLDDRWVLLDPTWDSRSIYYTGSGIKGDHVDTYFDSTLDFFSYGHLQTVADEYEASTYIKYYFSDIKNHWAYDYIKFAVNNDIMHGMGGSIFQPDGRTTQAMFITMLSYCAGLDLRSAGASPWYRPFTDWAEREGITAGVRGYDPDARISREQMAVMLRNFIVSQNSSVEDHSHPQFADIGRAGSWSRGAIRQLQSWNVLSGKGNNMFDPKGGLTRAEAAVTVRNACDIVLRTYLDT